MESVTEVFSGALIIHYLQVSSSSNLIQERISQFILNNDNGEVNDSTLWETLKAVIRGHIISYAPNKSKKESERLKEIEQDFSTKKIHITIILLMPLLSLSPN